MKAYHTLAAITLFPSLVMLPSLVMAQEGLDGRYSLDCDAIYSDSRIEIADGWINFHESSCELTNPTSVRDMPTATLFDMECTGEGESWTRRILLMRDYDGALVRVEDGFAAVYPSCS